MHINYILILIPTKSILFLLVFLALGLFLVLCPICNLFSAFMFYRNQIWLPLPAFASELMSLLYASVLFVHDDNYCALHMVMIWPLLCYYHRRIYVKTCNIFFNQKWISDLKITSKTDSETS